MMKKMLNIVVILEILDVIVFLIVGILALFGIKIPWFKF